MLDRSRAEFTCDAFSSDRRILLCPLYCRSLPVMSSKQRNFIMVVSCDLDDVERQSEKKQVGTF